MCRLSNRVLAAVGAGVFAMGLMVNGGVPADAAPASGPIMEARDLLGVWVGEMTGYNEAQEVDLQYRLTVRKAKGQAGIAWEEWRNCEENRAACAAGKTTGGGWTQPSRILFVMDKGHVVHGVGETGGWIGTPNSTGDVLSAVKVCQGAPDGVTWTTGASTSDTQATMQLGRHVIGGDMVRQPD